MANIPVSAPAPLLDLDRARALMRDHGLDAIVGHSLRNAFYLSGFVSFEQLIEPEAEVFAIVPARPDVPAHVTIPMSERLVLEDFPAWAPGRVFYGRYYVKGGPDMGESAPDPFTALAQALARCEVTTARVGFELELLPVRLYQRLADIFPRMAIVDASPLLRQLRSCKTSEEISRIRTATRVTEAAIAEAFAQIRVGTTEKAIAAWIAEGILHRGAEPLYVHLGTNGRGALGTCYPTDRPVQKGDVIRADASAQYGLYYSDLGRCCVVGEPSAEQRGHYQTMYDAVQAAIGAVRVGRTVSEVFAAAVAVPKAAGYDDFRRHHVGHGIGLQPHEWPVLRPEGTERIAPGMVLAVEVPYYLYGIAGYAPEDNIVVHDREVEVLSHAPAQLPVVG